jgi:hypothetical protein
VRRRLLVGFIALGSTSLACAAILGIDEPTDRPAGDAAMVDTDGHTPCHGARDLRQSSRGSAQEPRG